MAGRGTGAFASPVLIDPSHSRVEPVPGSCADSLPGLTDGWPLAQVDPVFPFDPEALAPGGMDRHKPVGKIALAGRAGRTGQSPSP